VQKCTPQNYKETVVKEQSDANIIVVPEKAVIIVRSDKEIAQAVMAAGPDFAKIHKQHRRDHFILRNSK
jgi:hypothetical protein